MLKENSIRAIMWSLVAIGIKAPKLSNNTIPELYKNSSFTNDDIPQDWRWVADVNTPTNRKLNMPYTKGVSYTSVIDHYLISPNVSVELRWLICSLNILTTSRCILR